MSEVKRYWSHPNDAGAQIEMVSFSEYDALAQQLAIIGALCEDSFNEIAELRQQLAASEAKHEAARDRKNSITLLKQQLAARDKRIDELEKQIGDRDHG